MVKQFHEVTRNPRYCWLSILIFLEYFCICVSRSVVSNSATPQTAAHQASLSWNSPSKNTGVDCHSLLHRVFLEQLYCLRLSPNFKAHSQNTHPMISAYITSAKTRQCCHLLQIRMVNVVAFFKLLVSCPGCCVTIHNKTRVLEARGQWLSGRGSGDFATEPLSSDLPGLSWIWLPDWFSQLCSEEFLITPILPPLNETLKTATQTGILFHTSLC